MYDDRNNPPRWGCEDKVGALSSTLKLNQVAGWTPNIVIEPRALPAGSAVITRTISSPASAAPASAASEGVSAALTHAALTPSALPPPAQTVTETLPLFQPTLAITVTLPQKAPPGQLNIQVLPAYEPSSGSTPMTAPWAAAAALDATNPLTYTQVISLESRIASGFVRVWISDTVSNSVLRESITQFYIDQSWGQKFLAGLWGDSRVGMGGDSRVGMGGDSRVGMGGDSRVGMGGDSRVGMGGDSRVGMGGDSRVGMGGDSRVGMGGDSRVGMGGDSRVGMGGDSRVGMGGDSRVGMGGDSRVGMGGDSRVGMGGDSRVGMGSDLRALGVQTGGRWGPPSLHQMGRPLSTTGKTPSQIVLRDPCRR